MALEKDEQALFINFLKNSDNYNHWYPIFAVMLGTGMRVGEVIGLRWQDIDFEKNTISVNHTLIYYNKGKGRSNIFTVNPPKTKSGYRTIPMLPEVREAFLQEKQYQADAVTGATNTSNGVSNMLKDCLSNYIEYFKTLKTK
jgi:integrase